MDRTGRKEGNVLFNDALNTFYLRLYGVRHTVMDHSDSEKGNPLSPHRLLFPINRATHSDSQSYISLRSRVLRRNGQNRGTKDFYKILHCFLFFRSMALSDI